MTIKDAAAEIIRPVYEEWSNDGRGGLVPVTARNMYYGCRLHILEQTGRHSLDGQYFAQTILPHYIASHAEETENWDIVYDARGHFAEPHTKVITPLGTLDVRRYLARISSHTVDPIEIDLDDDYPTCGPDSRFGAMLWSEKETFLPLWISVKLAERYDLAIMSSKGMPVVACRHLADEICGTRGIPLCILHDLDKAGFSMRGTLFGFDHYDSNFNERLKRYKYRHDFRIIDFGLHLEDVKKWKLESEPVTYKGDPSENLEQNGATKEEIEFLRGSRYGNGYRGKRVELNAFKPADLVKFIEVKLREHGIDKLVPDNETLTVAYRRAWQIAAVYAQANDILDETAEEAEAIKPPGNLEAMIRKRFKKDPSLPWDRVIADLARANYDSQ